jgi:hypothetical protein
VTLSRQSHLNLTSGFITGVDWVFVRRFDDDNGIGFGDDDPRRAG